MFGLFNFMANASPPDQQPEVSIEISQDITIDYFMPAEITFVIIMPMQGTTFSHMLEPKECSFNLFIKGLTRLDIGENHFSCVLNNKAISTQTLLPYLVPY